MSEQDITSALAATMAAEDRRREVASMTPGLGVLLNLPQPPGGPGVGLSDNFLPVIGEGYDLIAPDDAQQMKAYGLTRPHYAGAEVGGDSYVPGIAQPARRAIINAGEDGLWIEAAPGTV